MQLVRLVRFLGRNDIINMTTPHDTDSRTQLKILAKERGWTIRETRSARISIFEPNSPIQVEILEAINDSYFRNCVVSLPFSKELQLNLSWMADTWNECGSVLPNKSTAFSGNNVGKRWAIILEE